MKDMQDNCECFVDSRQGVVLLLETDVGLAAHRIETTMLQIVTKEAVFIFFLLFC
jgi:hypothetical protein